MLRNLKIALVLLFAFNSSFFGQIHSHRFDRKWLEKEIDSILTMEVVSDKIPGAVIRINENNRCIFQKAYGYSGIYDYNDQPLSHPSKMTVKDLFDLASLTKVIGTTTSIMLLHDRGKINVEDRVGKYIEGFNTPEKKEITIRHLLTHTSGITEWYPMYYICSDKECCYKLIAGLPLKYPVGSRRSYSDLGFVLLGQIIERVSELSLEQFMFENIFRPLGMKNTIFNPAKNAYKGNIASTSHGNPYERRMVYDTSLGFTVPEIIPEKWNGWRSYTLTGEVNDGNAWYANKGISGAAGLFSTATDIQKIIDVLLNDGRAGKKQFISKKTIDKFLKMDRFNNGLGWMMDPTNSFMKDGPPGTFGHTGFTGTSIVVLPKYKTSVILLVNRQNTGLSNDGEYYNLNPLRRNIFKLLLQYLSLSSTSEAG